MLINLQKQILIFFSSIQNPVLNNVGSFFSLFGEELFPLAIGLLVFWCFDKKKGQICLLIASSNLISMFIKAIVKFPRPWVLCPQLNSIGKADAEGFSFPSGHSSMANCFYPTLYMCYRKTWIKVITVFLCIVVPFTRLYLCCHWPQDVVVGTILGLSCSILGFRFLKNLVTGIEKKLKPILMVGITGFSFGLIIAVLLQFDLVDFESFSDISKLVGFSSILLIGLPVETIISDFSTEGSLLQKIIRYLVGIIGLLFIMVGIKKLLPYVPIITYFRFALTGVWACFYPLLGKKLKLFN